MRWTMRNTTQAMNLSTSPSRPTFLSKARIAQRAVVVTALLGICLFPACIYSPSAMGPDPTTPLRVAEKYPETIALFLPENRAAFQLSRPASGPGNVVASMDFGPAVARIFHSEYSNLVSLVVPTVKREQAEAADLALSVSVNNYFWSVNLLECGVTVQVTVSAWTRGGRVWGNTFQHEARAEHLGTAAIASLVKAARSSAIALQENGLLARYARQNSALIAQIRPDALVTELYYTGNADPHLASNGSYAGPSASDYTGLLTTAGVLGVAGAALAKNDPQLLALANSLAGTSGSPSMSGSTDPLQPLVGSVDQAGRNAGLAGSQAYGGQPQGGGSAPSANQGQGCEPLPSRCKSASDRAMRLLQQFKEPWGARAAASQGYCEAWIGENVNRACAADYRALGKSNCASLNDQQAAAYAAARKQYLTTVAASSEESELRSKCPWQ